MIVELGHFALILSLCVAMVQVVSSSVGAFYRNTHFIKMGKRATILQFMLLVGVFFTLIISFVRSDFSLILVATHSHIAKPLLYKISAVWGNHEGSMVLWILILSGYGVGIVQFSRHISDVFIAHILSVQGALGCAFLAFSIFTSNPFIRSIDVPYMGQGFNPILQDPALALHPPLLYIGYVGFSVIFSCSVALLLGRKIDPHWIHWMKSWVLCAWIFLTLGITLGSFWAYYELGWGGFWFWDPVENASLMPWISATALFHAMLVAVRRNVLRHWIILLSILTFGLSIIGTFLVRSGVLTSVHAFANDPERGVGVLVIFTFFVGGALLLYVCRRTKFDVEAYHFSFLSRETSIIMNNILLVTVMVTIFVGTLYPLLIETLGLGTISVGAPYFNTVLLPLIIPILLFLPLGSFLHWGEHKDIHVLKYLIFLACFSVCVGCGIWVLQENKSWKIAMAIAVIVWSIIGSVMRLFIKMRLNQTRLMVTLNTLRYVSVRKWGGILAHMGVGITLFGVLATTSWKDEFIGVMQRNETISLARYDITFLDVISLDASNYQAEQGHFGISYKGRKLSPLKPEKRFYATEKSNTTEVAISKKIRGFLYIVLGDRQLNEQGEESYIIRVWYHPFVAFIWIGACIMAWGGVLTLICRRHHKVMC